MQDSNISRYVCDGIWTNVQWLLVVFVRRELSSLVRITDDTIKMSLRGCAFISGEWCH